MNFVILCKTYSFGECHCQWIIARTTNKNHTILIYISDIYITPHLLQIKPSICGFSYWLLGTRGGLSYCRNLVLDSCFLTRVACCNCWSTEGSWSHGRSSNSGVTSWKSAWMAACIRLTISVFGKFAAKGRRTFVYLRVSFNNKDNHTYVVSILFFFLWIISFLVMIIWDIYH